MSRKFFYHDYRSPHSERVTQGHGRFRRPAMPPLEDRPEAWVAETLSARRGDPWAWPASRRGECSPAAVAHGSTPQVWHGETRARDRRMGWLSPQAKRTFGPTIVQR